MKRLVIIVVGIFLVCSSYKTAAQTPAEKSLISQTYNQTYLSQLQKDLFKKSTEEKQYALAQAKIHSWPITIHHDDGGFSELMKVVEGSPIYYTTFNADAAISTRANFLHNGGGLGLNLEGQNMEAHIWDGGLARITHQEYDGVGGNNRFSIGDGTTGLHYHSAHVTGTIIASGVQAQAKGMAPQAYAVGYDWDFDVSEATTAAANSMLLSNHSYGYDTSHPLLPDWYFGAYNDESRDWDVLMYNAPYYLMVNAAGNDGNNDGYNSNPLEGNSAYDKLAGHSTSKNTLVVANAQDASIYASGNLASVSINSSSSEGPTDDYRIKPDITGNGTGLYSTYEDANDSYASISGTSMASPNVTGSLLLLQQHYNNLNLSYMKAATLKGLALHTADDAGTAGPDAIFGWGLLNAKVAANTISKNANETLIDERTLNDGQTYQLTVEADGVNDLVASISWTDPAGTANTGTANDTTPVLVNDLDIRITQVANTYHPYRLTSITTNGTGDNLVDPYERIDISGASGTYTITVSHKGSLSGGSQDFSLIVTGIQYVGVCNATTPTNFNLLNVGDTNASLAWDSVQGANYEVRYRETGTTIWFTQITSEEVITLTGLTKLTEYEAQVRSFCQDNSTSAYSDSVVFTTTDCYICSSSGSTQYPDGTTLVSFNLIDNASTGASAYSDYTAISTEVIIGDSYDLTIHVNTDGNYKEVSKVWIDWNGDCFFNTTDEEYDLGEAVNVADGITSNSPLSITIPTSAVLGSTTMRVSSAYTSNPIVYPTSCQTDFLGEVEDYTLIISNCLLENETIWNGTIWSNGIPDITKPVIIDGLYNGTTNFTCCSLTINVGAILNVSAGEYLQVENNIVNNGTLEIAHEGSLVQVNETDANTGTGTYKIHKTTRPYHEYDYTFWSSSIVGDTIENVFGTHSSVIVPGGEPSNGIGSSPANYIWWFDTDKFVDLIPVDDFDDDSNDWIHASGTMEKGKGYIAMGAGSDFPFNTNFASGLVQKVYFEGDNVNNGSFTYSVELDGDQTDGFDNENLIGNPYPSAIDVEKLMAANATILDGNFYFWTHDSAISSGNTGPWAYNFTNADYAQSLTGGIPGDYVAVSGGTDGTDLPFPFVASGQGFLATVQDGIVNPSNIVFNNAMRVTGPNNQFRNTTQNQNKIWLNLTNDFGVYRQIYVGFRENATDGFKSGQDGKRMQSVVDADFYSIIPNDTRHFAIQNLATFNEMKTVALGLEIIAAGEYIFTIDHVEGVFETAQDIYLKDFKTNTVHNLSDNRYVFTVTDTELGEITNRFELRFVDDTAGLDEAVIYSIVIYPNPSTSIFNISWNGGISARIEVYDLLGKLVKTEKLKQNTNSCQLDLSGYSNGVYFAKIQIDGQQVVNKLVLK